MKESFNMKYYLGLISILTFMLSCSTEGGETAEATTGDVKSPIERIKNVVMSDGHPVAVWEKSKNTAEQAVLLVHGRTWSAVPDFDLQVEGEDVSLMDALVEEGYAVYAVDLRGYGATPRDSSQWFTPNQAAKDLKAVLEWINQQKVWDNKPHLFGWSMGSSNSQLAAQRYPGLISSAILFGYWVDADEVFEQDADELEPKYIVNTKEAAISDFLTPGINISQAVIDKYAEECLLADTAKVDWKNLDDYNELDPERLKVPILLIQGEDDPIAPTDRQSKLFTRLKVPYKQWVTVKGDHAAFMESGKREFLSSMVNFMHLVEKEFPSK